jgi:hypothetical protein
MFEIQWILSAGAKTGIYSEEYLSLQWLLWDINFSSFKG